MSRQEHHREDLLAEATALVERAEFKVADEPEPVVIGFRRNGAAGIYFGQDVAYQFNAENQLRRAFVDDRLIKADSGRLASLARVRTADEVQLVRYDLDAAESQTFLVQMSTRIGRFRDELTSRRAVLMRQFPESGDATSRINNWLGQLPNPIEIARTPRAGV